MLLGDILCIIGKALGGGAGKCDPSDWLPKEAIEIADNKVVIDLSRLPIDLTEAPRVWSPDIPGTGSMLPNFGKEHNNILISGVNSEDHAAIVQHLEVGDIAVYRMMTNDEDDPADFTMPARFYAIHRIAKIEHEGSGKLFTFRGDHNPFNDPYKAQERNILHVSIGTIY